MGSVVELYRVCPVPRLPDVIDQENRRRRNRDGKVHRGAGIALFKIVLGLMCPGGPSRRGESQNEAKSRRSGMDLPSRAFYEGVNPKTILNNSMSTQKCSATLSQPLLSTFAIILSAG